MFRDRDFDPKGALPAAAATLTQDLGLDVLLDAMAAGDEFVRGVARQAILAGLREPAEIDYRQRILADCLEQPALVREMYALAVEAIERERKIWGWTLNRYPEGLLHRSLDVLGMLLELLARLRRVADEHAPAFRSEGFARFFRMLAEELDDAYLEKVKEQLAHLEFREGVLMSAALGAGNKGTRYVLRKPREGRPSLLQRLQAWVEQVTTTERTSFVYQVADRDEAGLQALADLRSRGVALIAASLGQSADHILGFFGMLRTELGFYVGCLNLRDRLSAKDEPIAMPEPLPAGADALRARGLYDVSLSLALRERAVGNDLSADHERLVMITGANRGGKTTFMRSVGQAQLMMQCGLFAPAESFCAAACAGLFTHFKREEDPGLRSGKLDEELARMSAIIDQVRPRSLVLLNESFASTNEREGSQIARQVVRALLEAGVRVLYVTHLYDLAQGFYLSDRETALFLRAERLSDGRRTFRLIEGEPLPTSYGADLYRRIFDEARTAESVDAGGGSAAAPGSAAEEGSAAPAGSGVAEGSVAAAGSAAAEPAHGARVAGLQPALRK